MTNNPSPQEPVGLDWLDRRIQMWSLNNDKASIHIKLGQLRQAQTHISKQSTIIAEMRQCLQQCSDTMNLCIEWQDKHSRLPQMDAIIKYADHLVDKSKVSP